MNSNIHEDDINIGNLIYLEYLSKYNKDKLKDFLPEELFDYYYVEIEHFDRDERKDYSYGFRRTVTNRYFTYMEKKEYYELNIENFNRWLKINYKILNENIETTYKEYLKNIGKYNKKIEKEKNDDYDEIENIKKTSYIFLSKL